MQKEIYTQLLSMVENREPAALVTVVETKGSSPGKAGFRMLVDACGRTWGTVGGGLLEATVTREAVEAMQEKKSRVKTYILTQDKARGLGMVCGGEITVFIDAVIPPETLVIVGAGHVAQPLAALAGIMNFSTVVIDDRADFCNSERFPGSDCRVGEIVGELDKLKLDGNSYVVIVTRGHMLDQAALEKTIDSGAAYVGMIGSKIKVAQVFDHLRKNGVSETSINAVCAPVGLDIGAKTAEEIAVSIMAQIISCKNGKSGDGGGRKV